MKIGDAFPSSSKYLKAEDLGPLGARVVVTIEKVAVEEAWGEKKPVLYFTGKEKRLTLNKTNAFQLAGITGTEETEDWPGHKVTLYTVKVPFEGKMVPAIRIEDAPFEQRQTPPPAPSKPSIADEDIPF